MPWSIPSENAAMKKGTLDTFAMSKNGGSGTTYDRYMHMHSRISDDYCNGSFY
jgi:hypothetical protein